MRLQPRTDSNLCMSAPRVSVNTVGYNYPRRPLRTGINVSNDVATNCLLWRQRPSSRRLLALNIPHSIRLHDSRERDIDYACDSRQAHKVLPQHRVVDPKSKRKTVVDVTEDALAARWKKWLLRILIAKNLILHTFPSYGKVLRLSEHKRKSPSSSTGSPT